MFKLDFEFPEAKEKINLRDKIYLIGSCFSDEIGVKLTESKFNALSNPFGTVYNPISIFKLLGGQTSSLNQTVFQDIHYHWDCHGDISGTSKEDLTDLFEHKQNESRIQLEEAKWLIITLGTATVYELKATGDVVANCHKHPGNNFIKRLLSVEEVVSNFDATLKQIRSINKDIRIIFTVSPVRHVKDGLVTNNISKSVLLNSVHQIITNHPEALYFPSYEIVMDELRDYRFYKKDLVHPNELAVDYILDRFVQTYLDSETRSFLKEWNKLKSAIRHKPFHPSSPSHQKFLKETIKKLSELNDLVDISQEKAELEKQLL